ncbi:MAG: permease [Planctomycetes bacterium]|nr:permease [Planctomycetota bacterium]
MQPSTAAGPTPLSPESRRQLLIGGGLLAAFLAAYFLPVGQARFDGAVNEGLQLVRWYTREHVVLCLLPAFFIAGAIGVFVRRESVMRYLGAGASRPVAYGVASVAGTLLAVCSCTVLPLFAGIWRMGAGLGPASAFLYSGPAINVLAIVLTARVLGIDIGAARAVGAIGFAVVIGLAMAALFRREEAQRQTLVAPAASGGPTRSLWQTATWFGLMAAILIFATWSEAEREPGIYATIARFKWILTSLVALGFAVALRAWFGVAWWKLVASAAAVAVLAFTLPDEPTWAFAVGIAALGVITATSKGELRDWFDSTWEFTKQIAPLLLGGVFVAGLLLGRPGHEGLIPSEWVAGAVGGNSLGANFLSALVGALMYFATLTEIPIVQGLVGSGMGKGPALALLLAGPALSLPSMLVLHSVMGARKTLAFCALVVGCATLTGWCFGLFV